MPDIKIFEAQVCSWNHYISIILFYFVFVSSPLIALFLLCSVVDFFKELPQFIVKVGPTLSKHFGLDWEKRLEVLIFSS